MKSSDLEGDGFFGRHLGYIPAGPTDPNVVFGPDFDQAAFFALVADKGRFVYESFSDRSIERTYINRSLWEARIGVDIKFGGD